MNVIIKGIDPNSVGKVPDLVSDLDAKRFEPLLNDAHDLRVPQHSRNGSAIDPPPDDMPSAGEPIAFSTPEPGPAADLPGRAGSVAGEAHGRDDAFGGDAVRVIRIPRPPCSARHRASRSRTWASRSRPCMRGLAGEATRRGTTAHACVPQGHDLSP